MLASAAPLTFPPVIEPPMITMSLTSAAIDGSFETASAIFVKGPTGINVISCGYLWTISIMRSGPNRGSFLHFAGGNSTLARPFFPWHNRQRFHPQLGRIQRQDDSHGIVGARIRVDDHSLGHGLGETGDPIEC